MYVGELKRPYRGIVKMRVHEKPEKLIAGAEHVELVSEGLLQHRAADTGGGGCFFKYPVFKKNIYKVCKDRKSQLTQRKKIWQKLSFEPQTSDFLKTLKQFFQVCLNR